MSRRLEFHGDHVGFLTAELEKLARVPFETSWEALFGVLGSPANTQPFQRVIEHYCRELEWPELRGAEHAQACARLHFAVWFVIRFPWEVTDGPKSGAGYLRELLIDRFELYRHQGVTEVWAGVVDDEE
jgi:hypothetical protein